MVFIHLALVLDELGDTIHRRFVFSNLIFNDLCCLQFIRLPGKTAINRPVQNAWQFLDEFIAKSFVLFISTECPIEWNCFDATPNSVISVVDLWQTIRGQPQLSNDVKLNVGPI